MDMNVILNFILVSGALVLIGGVVKFLIKAVSGPHPMLNKMCTIKFYDQDGDIVPISDYGGKMLIIEHASWIGQYYALKDRLSKFENGKNVWIQNDEIQWIIFYQSCVSDQITYDLKKALELIGKENIAIPCPILLDKDAEFWQNFNGEDCYQGYLILDRKGIVRCVPGQMKSTDYYETLINNLLNENNSDKI